MLYKICGEGAKFHPDQTAIITIPGSDDVSRDQIAEVLLSCSKVVMGGRKVRLGKPGGWKVKHCLTWWIRVTRTLCLWAPPFS